MYHLSFYQCQFAHVVYGCSIFKKVCLSQKASSHSIMFVLLPNLYESLLLTWKPLEDSEAI